MKAYGVIGLLLIIFSLLNLTVFRIEPLLSWNFPITWFGLIFFVDSLVYKLRGDSLISNHLKKFIGMLLLSVIIWWILEFFNLFIKNWSYSNVPEPQAIAFSIAFSTVLPAMMELFDLMSSLNIFKNFKVKINLNRIILYSMFILGLVTFILPILFPFYFFWMVWLTFFFLFEPINYFNKQPSIIGYLEKGKLQIILYLLLAGTICGFFWEFFNNWAFARWVYHMPWVSEHFPKLFEMPLLGYLGYFPFALELFAIYNFVRYFFVKQKSRI